MAVATGTAIAMGATALASGVAAANQSGQTSVNQVTSVNAGQAGAQEQFAGQTVNDILKQYSDQVQAGPGQQAVTDANSSQNDLASMLQQYARGGYNPTASDFNQANSFANSAFAPRQVALDQSFEQSSQDAARMAAQLNRPINDPIIQAKLQQERIRQNASLGADKSAFVANYAQQQPIARLGFQQDLATLRTGLATQAMQNRQALLGLGSQVQAQGQQFRLLTAQRASQSIGDNPRNKLGSFLTGAVAGGAAGGQIANAFASTGNSPGQTIQTGAGQSFTGNDTGGANYFGNYGSIA